MITEAERQSVTDEEQLRWLPVGYWVSAGFIGAYALFMASYFAFIGVLFLSIPEGDASGPPAGMAWALLGFGAVMFLAMAAVTTLKAMSGFWIRKRTHRVWILATAAISCLEVPYGTLLGVLTFLVMTRPSVRALFDLSESDSTSDATVSVGDGQNETIGSDT